MKVVKSLIFILFALCSLSGKAQEVAADSTGYIVRVGEMAPNFTITLTDGKKVTLSELRGKVVMLQFTASWCGVCGKIIYTKDLIFKGGSHGSTLSIIPEEKAKEMAGKLPEVPKSPSNHFENFLLACMGQEKTRSPFEINGVLGQVFSLGVIAQRLNTQIFFDPRTKQITNNEFANAMLAGVPPRKGWDEFYKL